MDPERRHRSTLPIMSTNEEDDSVSLSESPFVRAARIHGFVDDLESKGEANNREDRSQDGGSESDEAAKAKDDGVEDRQTSGKEGAKQHEEVPSERMEDAGGNDNGPAVGGADDDPPPPQISTNSSIGNQQPPRDPPPNGEEGASVIDAAKRIRRMRLASRSKVQQKADPLKATRSA